MLRLPDSCSNAGVYGTWQFIHHRGADCPSAAVDNLPYKLKLRMFEWAAPR